MKTLYVIGDSISMHYGPYLAELLPDEWQLRRKRGDEAYRNLDVAEGENNGDSHNVREYLKFLFARGDFHPDLLLLNCGLHDIKMTDGGHQVEAGPYADNLAWSLDALLLASIPTLFVATTPVVDALHNARQPAFTRSDVDAVRYNAIACRLAQMRNVPIVDLYAFTKPFLPEGLLDHIHYRETVRKKQAEFLYSAICDRL